MSEHRDVSWQTADLTDPVTNGRGPRRSQSPWREDAYAVIVGINTYRDPHIPDLRFARNDAEEVYRVLTDPSVGRFNPDNVITLLDADATERRIRSALGTQLRRRTSKDSTVCVYYAGHGAPVIDVEARPRSADSIEKYLVPHDAEADDLRSSAISMDSIQECLTLDVRQVICFFDTCYSGAAGGRSFERNLYRPRALNFSDEHLDRLAGEGRVVITACEKDEISLESSEKGHGLFTYYVVRGLRGEADANGDGRITVDELYDYVYDRVYRDARAMDGKMSPLRKGSVRGRVYLTDYRAASGERQAESETLRQNDFTPDVPATVHRWRVTLAAMLATAALLSVGLVGWWWYSSQPHREEVGAAATQPPTPIRDTPPPSPGPGPSNPGERPTEGNVATGSVELTWVGSSNARWRVVDPGRKVIAEAVASPGSTSRVTVGPGDFFVVLEGFPELGRLPVNVTAGGTSALIPRVGRVEVNWNGSSPATATVKDEKGASLRSWTLPSKGPAVFDLGEGTYSIAVANASERAVTVRVGRAESLTLKPDVAPPPISTPDPSPPPMGKPPEPPPPNPRRAAAPPYVPEPMFKLPSSNDLGFALVAAGSFRMGSDPDRHRAALLDERPRATVSLPAYYISRFEVTVDQYKACVEDGGCRNKNPMAVNGPVDLPVRYISWDEAVQYCTWLDGKLRSSPGTPPAILAALTGTSGGPAWKVRLPSEAEWEKAARGTTDRIYPWGDTLDESRANYGNHQTGPTPVGGFPTGVSPFGLYDMSGNVWEWTRSRYRLYPYQPSNDREDSRPTRNEMRVIRGGSFQTKDPWAAQRNRGRQDETTDFTGFRLVIGPPQ
jgi:formylglycine-generating enzyme required for sulfatase activity/uncharacterized caspase-like protein